MPQLLLLEYASGTAVVVLVYNYSVNSPAREELVDTTSVSSVPPALL
jgi:hypothetical protein